MTGLCFAPLPACGERAAAIASQISHPTKTTPTEAPTTLFMKSLRFGIFSPLVPRESLAAAFSAFLRVLCVKPSKTPHRAHREERGPQSSSAINLLFWAKVYRHSRATAIGKLIRRLIPRRLEHDRNRVYTGWRDDDAIATSCILDLEARSWDC